MGFQDLPLLSWAISIFMSAKVPFLFHQIKNYTNHVPKGGIAIPYQSSCMGLNSCELSVPIVQVQVNNDGSSDF